jgi:hypothetical protein
LRPINAYPPSTLGTPSEKPRSGSFQTKEGVIVNFNVSDIDDSNAEIESIVAHLDNTKGNVLPVCCII